MQRIEDLMIDSSETVGGYANYLNRAQSVAERATILEDRLVALRRSNRHDIVNQFDKEEHRLEHVTQYQGVNFVNDSKACTVNATYYTFETIKSDVIWLAGGNDENNDYIDLVSHVIQRVRTLICIGEENRKLIGAFSKYVKNIREEANMEDAVRLAFYSANKGNIVLLSTGCECDSLYPDYQTRGTSFKKAIAQL
jgi:UDP-N-acetylmuramoylalanine--D-glutamate ligase